MRAFKAFRAKWHLEWFNIFLMFWPAFNILWNLCGHQWQMVNPWCFALFGAFLFWGSEYHHARMEEIHREHSDWCFKRAMEYKSQLEAELGRAHDEGEGWKK